MSIYMKLGAFAFYAAVSFGCGSTTTKAPVKSAESELIDELQVSNSEQVEDPSLSGPCRKLAELLSAENDPLNENAFHRLFDYEAIARQGLDQVEADLLGTEETVINAYLSGLKSANVSYQVEGAWLPFANASGRCLLYNTGDDGVSALEVRVVELDAKEGGFKVVDFKNARMLAWASEMAAQSLKYLYEGDPFPPRNGYAFTTKDSWDERVTIGKNISALRGAAASDALATFSGLSAEQKRALVVASAISSVEADSLDHYAELLSQIMALHPASKNELYFLDFALVTGDAPLIHAIFQNFRNTYGDLAVMHRDESYYLQTVGATKMAARSAERVLELDPYNSDSYFSVLNVAVRAKNYDAAVEALQVMHALDSGVDFSQLNGDGFYEGLFASEQYRAWQASL